MGLLFTIQLLCTWFMCGVIWVIQLVHYPLFDEVGDAHFVTYEARHTRRITVVVLIPMVVELATAIGLCVFPPTAGPPHSVWLSLLVLVALIWASTALLQVPAHQRLQRRFDPDVHRRLVATNWVRTMLWSVRAAALAIILGSALGNG